MNGRQTRWLTGVVALVGLLASLGCSICPLIPRPSPTSTPVREATPTREATAAPTAAGEATPTPAGAGMPTPIATATPTPAPTQGPAPEMRLYSDALAGFSILYPADWNHEAEEDGALFSDSEAALASGDPTDGSILGVMTGSPDELALLSGASTTPEDFLDAVLEELLGEQGAEVGTRESWTFGETPGAGVEARWTDERTDAQLHGYIVAAVGEEISGIGLVASPENEWSAYEPIFRDMFASLELFPPETPEPIDRGSIQPGETVQGTLSRGGRDVWSFEAQKDAYITIQMDTTDPLALDPYLELYDEDGELIIEDDDSGEGANALIADLRVPAAGTYYIHARPYEGAGDYTLRLEISEEPFASGTIEYGQTIKWTPTESTPYSWFFEGSAGDVVTIAMNALDEDLDCYLELYGPGDVLLTEDDDSGEGYNALIEAYELPTDGVYRIVSKDISGEIGEYELTLEQTELVLEGALAYGETRSATLKAGTRHQWQFTGQEGDVVTISMTDLSENIDAFLELFAPDGVRVMIDDDSGEGNNAEIAEFRLPMSGTYRIVARGYGDEDAGEYELVLTGP
jgi:hypothetical protein